MKVIIVEDNLIGAMVLELLLVNNGFDVVGKYENAAQAKVGIVKDVPDVILMDVMLNEVKSGMELAKELREEDNQIPIVFISALSDINTLKKAKGISASHYLVKPYDDEELLSVLKEIVNS